MTEEKDTQARDQLLDILGRYKPQHNDPAEVDCLYGRFQVLTQQPLPEFNHSLATAYAASDTTNPDKKIYALALNSTMPYRTQETERLINFNHPNFQAVLGRGNIYLSSDNKKHQVLFLERPVGRSLRSVLDQAQKMHEHQVIDHVLSPLAKALLSLREKDVVHGNLNPQTIYIGGESFMTECLSSPYGYFQDYIYEPLERVMATPMANGAGDERCDVYALAIVAFEACFGLEHIRKLSRKGFVNEALNIGTYHIFSNGIDLSDNISDFFRGAMSDNLDERWGLEQFQQWLGGKRYNMIVPPAPKDSSRPLTFLSAEYFSRRALANALHKNWRATLKDLWDLRVDRWLEMGVHRVDLAQQAERVLRIGGSGSTDRNNQEMLARLIALLDPLGPIRTQNLALRPEGVGITLAKLMLSDTPNITQELIGIIESDLPNYWTYLIETEKPQALTQVIWKIQRVKGYSKIKGMGFGIERLLYEFNPTLACQSELIKEFNAQTIQDVLEALDSLAPTIGKSNTLLDRHISAFLACKLDIGKEVKVQDVSQVPALANNQELVSLRILSRAQQKIDKNRYVGLATWAALRVETMLEAIHNRALRKQLKARLKSAANSGKIPEVFGVLVNREIIQKDQEGFGRALRQYMQNELTIKKLKDKGNRNKISRALGGRVSSVVGYVVLIASFYYIAGKIKGG